MYNPPAATVNVNIREGTASELLDGISRDHRDILAADLQAQRGGAGSIGRVDRNTTGSISGGGLRGQRGL